jgi:transposase-like protein
VVQPINDLNELQHKLGLLKKENHSMRTVLKAVRKINRKPLVHAKTDDILNDQFQGLEGPIDTQHMLISMMLPPAVKEFVRQLEEEVDLICGARYKHGKVNQRWGSQPGSIVLGNQQVAIERRRVRSKVTGEEVKLETYEQFQDPKHFHQAVFTEGLKKVSQRDYQKGVQKIASSFGFKKSSISRKWIYATAKKIEELQKRSLKEMDIRAVFIDGKRFSKYGVIIALGVGSNGRKYILGIYQASSEDHESCLNLLADLESRGLPTIGLLFCVDGGSGLNKALDIKYFCHDKLRRRAVRIRCHVHKWRNIESALGDDAHKVAGLFWALRDASDMAEAKVCSDRLEAQLRLLNLSVWENYVSVKDDLLVIHELKLSKPLKRFFSTTNPIESLNSMIEEDMRRVKRWQNSEHFQRWLATYCLANEKRMRRVRGFDALPALWVKLKMLTGEKQIDSTEAVA